MSEKEPIQPRHPFNGQLLFLAETFSRKDVAHWEAYPTTGIETNWCDEVTRQGTKKLLAVTAIRGLRSKAIKSVDFLLCEGTSAVGISAKYAPKYATYNVPAAYDDPFATPIIAGFTDYLSSRGEEGVADCTQGICKALVRCFDVFDVSMPVQQSPNALDYMLMKEDQ